MSLLVAIRDLEVQFNGKRVLGPITWDLMRGEVVGVAGPNGSGKTTLARALVGFRPPSKGSVSVEGMASARWRMERGVGYLPEELPRPWRCRVGDVLSLRPDALRRVQEGEADAFGVAGMLERPLRVLSKGQWRAVLISFACLSDSGLVVLDEPDSGLDPSALERLNAMINHTAERGAAVVVLSHQLAELARACRKVAFVSQGTWRGEVDATRMSEIQLRESYHMAVAEGGGT